VANHALVIGCDRYWDDASALDGAVRDALAVRRWLLDPERGAVPRQNLTLLLSPTGRSQVPPALAGVPEVTRPTVVEAMEALLMRAEGDEGTLYFYFAGHGLTTHGDGYDEPCLLPSDFRPAYREPALPVRAVVEQFATSSLATQFLIVDACRGIPTGRAFRAAGLSDRRPRAYSRREPDQYTLVATGAGDVAYETDGGEFTGALLRGLHGAGAAKRWDAASERYVVRIRELFDYVRGDLARAGVAQAPRLGGSHNEPNPVLVHMPDGAVDPATLAVTVTPAEAAACTTVTAYGATEHDDRVTRPPLPTPLPLRLRPRTYTVRVDSPDFVTRRGRMTVDLYDDAELKIAMERGLAHSAPSAFAARPGFAPVSLDEGSTVVGPDPSALLEAVDEAGRVRLGAGELTLDLAGRYRVRVVEPHAAGPWSIVEVTDRWPERFFPTPPPPVAEIPLPAAGQGLVVAVTGHTGPVLADGVRLSDSGTVLPLPAGPAEVVLTGVLDRPLHVAAYAPGVLLIDGPQVLCLPVDAGLALRAERAQRFVSTGRIAEATAVLASGPAGPVGTALHGLLAARAGAAGADDVAEAAAALRRDAPDLPDTAVLTALVRSYNTHRPVPPALLAVPILSAALTTALNLYTHAGADPPALLTRPAQAGLPTQAITAWT
jgi:hypothetical protein